MAKQRKNPEEGKIPLTIKPGLVVFIKPDADPEKVKAKYLNKPLVAFGHRDTTPFIE